MGCRVQEENRLLALALFHQLEMLELKVSVSGQMTTLVAPGFYSLLEPFLRQSTGLDAPFTGSLNAVSAKQLR